MLIAPARILPARVVDYAASCRLPNACERASYNCNGNCPSNRIGDMAAVNQRLVEQTQCHVVNDAAARNRFRCWLQPRACKIVDHECPKEQRIDATKCREAQA